MDKVIEKFVNASIKYGEAIELGDSIKANRQSSIIRTIRKQLVQNCKTELLVSAIEHDNDYVKLNVATSLINSLPNESRKVLVDLQTRKGLVGFEAKMFLQEWEKGTIKYDDTL